MLYYTKFCDITSGSYLGVPPDRVYAKMIINVKEKSLNQGIYEGTSPPELAKVVKIVTFHKNHLEWPFYSINKPENNQQSGKTPLCK